MKINDQQKLNKTINKLHKKNEFIFISFLKNKNNLYYLYILLLI
jgi:hypothetical protein